MPEKRIDHSWNWLMDKDSPWYMSTKPHGRMVMYYSHVSRDRRFKLNIWKRHSSKYDVIITLDQYFEYSISYPTLATAKAMAKKFLEYGRPLANIDHPFFKTFFTTRRLDPMQGKGKLSWLDYHKRCWPQYTPDSIQMEANTALPMIDGIEYLGPVLVINQTNPADNGVYRFGKRIQWSENEMRHIQIIDDGDECLDAVSDACC